MRVRLDRATYYFQHWAILFHFASFRRILRLLLRRQGPAPDPNALDALRQRYHALLDRDLENVQQGLYPRELLFQIPFLSYIRKLPCLFAEIPRVIRRRRAADYEDLPAGVDLERYPSYFRRNFHWQTDGYFSRRSAELYDLGVEFLFLGTADVMRRQVIPPVSRFLREVTGSEARLLDIGCGTGRTLLQLAKAHPSLRLYGLDLSPYYLAVAREVLAKVSHISLVADDTESLPFRDGFFDIVISVFLFHELPGPARRGVVSEARRVLRPGGLLVVEDSVQLSESSELAFFLERFAADYHEPYYEEYLRDDLATLLSQNGFRIDSVEPHYLAKVVAARKGG